MEPITSTITLRGTLAQLPEPSHENHGKRFYRFFLDVARLSGTVDRLPVVVDAEILNAVDLSGGSQIRVTGQIRSHNLRTDGKRHLLIFVYATEMAAEEGPPENTVMVEGTLCREPSFRRTPLGREICDVMLAVPRAFHRADYLPCILWGRTAQEISACHTRDRIQITGRFQSRAYTKVTDAGLQERTAYEISALTAQILQQKV